MNKPLIGPQEVAGLLSNADFIKGISALVGQDINKADTISQATNLLWYDLRPIVQMLYPFKELIPRISKLPRVAGDGGSAYHWKRIVGINVNNISIGVSEGNRGGRIAITEEDQMASYKTLGLESSATFQARWGSKNLEPEALGIAVQSALRSLMIGEEQTLFLGNASSPLGTTPLPTLSAGGTTGAWGGTVTVYVICVALGGFGFLNYTPYSAGAGGVPGQVSRVNADGSTDTFGGGSAKPSAEASIAGVTLAQIVTASVTAVVGAVAYAWYVGTTSGAETLAGLTPSNRVTFSKNPGASQQPITALQVGGVYQDNSLNTLLFDGLFSQVYGSVFGVPPGTPMSTNTTLPTLTNGVITIAASGGIVCTMNAGNSGLTISGTNIAEFDAVFQAAYDQYKVGYDRILMSSVDLLNSMGAFFGSGDTAAQFRILFQADEASGRIVAGRRVTSYMNKVFNNTLDIEVHPFIPPGTVVFWSDRVPYELAGVANVLEMHVRQDYYQLQWPLRTMRYEYGVYCDEVLSAYFLPAFALICNLNPATPVAF